MAPKNTTTQVRLTYVTKSLAMAAETLEILAYGLHTPFLGVISKTAQSLLESIQSVEQNNKSVQLVEKTQELFNAIIVIHLKSDTAKELPPIVLRNIGKFAETLCKIHTFVEAQQNGSKIKRFFRHSEISKLFQDCTAGLQEGLNFFQVKPVDLLLSLPEMERLARERHEAILNIIEGLSDTTSSDASTMRYSRSYNSSNSTSMLPSEPKIFHGRELELADILSLFYQGTPRIAILGAGGMGKTSLARAVLHHSEILAKYGQQRYFICCDSTTNKMELAGLIGTHLGLKPGKDLTYSVVDHFSKSTPCLLVLDNLETLWEPANSRRETEDFLSLLTDVDHLALLITMRGAERPAQVHWTHPFLQPLNPLEAHAAWETFTDIADGDHVNEEVNKLLALTGNLPLAVNLLAHLADSDGCANVLSRWEEEKTGVVSQGYDQRSNLDFSISLSLSSPRIQALPPAQDLLSLLSILPDGLSDVELAQSNLPIPGILHCKATLLRTALAYNDGHKRLKLLVPIREYMHKNSPPGQSLLRPLLGYFKELLELHGQYSGSLSDSQVVDRITSNYSNIQNMLHKSLQNGHPDLASSIYCTCDLNTFSVAIGRGSIPLIDQIQHVLPQPCDHRLAAYFITELFSSWGQHPIPEPEKLERQVLEHITHFDDSDLKCRLYINLGWYHQTDRQDIPTAMKFCQSALSLAITSGNSKRECDTLYRLAWIKYLLGDYPAARLHAYESRRQAIISADLRREAYALRMEGISYTMLGDFVQSISCFDSAKDRLNICGMSRSEVSHTILNSQAEVHKYKSEYLKAKDIHTEILKTTAPAVYQHTLALLNLTEIGLCIDAPADELQRNINQVQSSGHRRLTTACNYLQADLNLRNRDMSGAEKLFCKTLSISWGKDSDIETYCLERLADVHRWDNLHGGSSWPVVFLVHSLRIKQKLAIHKALQFLGHIFLSQGEEDTAVNLFTVALEGFTYMSVHRSRADCMLELGDISKRHNPVKAKELWETARPLFEHSLQVKRVRDIDERLSGISEEINDKHQDRLS